MTRRWIWAVTLVISMGWSTTSAAQAPAPRATGEAPRLELGEELTIRGEAREVFGLYTAAGCFLGTAALMSLGGGLGLPMGDTISPPAAITLFTVPLIAMIGLSLVAIAAGYDAAVARWTEPANADAETRRWTTPPSAGI